MGYQTSIPDGFVPGQFKDETFYKALEAYTGGRLKHRPSGPWVVAIPRPELDPSSRVRYDLNAGVNYDIKAKTDKVAVMHVIGVGPGRVRLGYREKMPVAVGDLILINLREAGHWQWIEGLLTYWFTGDVCMVRMYRTAKPLTPPAPGPDRSAWEDELFWNIKDVLNDYVLLGRDPNAETKMRNGEGTLIELPGSALTDGTRSDDSRDSRFPIVYRRVLGAGPGRAYRREIEDGFPEYVHNSSEAEPGDMMTYSRNVRAALFTFQGMPLEVLHAASILDIGKEDSPRLLLDQTCSTTIPWDEGKEDGAADEEEQLKGKV